MATPISPEDRQLLQRAVEIARRGWGRVHPNPLVGCVLAIEGKVVAEGWHEEVGGDHAEVNALRRAGEKARGATAYVSLEPCNHFGRTPPCSSALVAAGIKRVVFGARDPGRTSGGGSDTLRSGGVEVAGPVLELEDARRENPAFFFNHEHGASYVALKLAQTLDGKIAEAPGRRTAITGPEALHETHRLRAGFDGVMVGSGTVLADDPLLTVREDVPLRKQPVRIVLDTGARLSPGLKLFEEFPKAPVMIFSADDAPSHRMAALEGAGASVYRVPRGPGGVSLAAVLGVLWDKGIRSVFCEGGGRLASELVRQSVAQRIYLFVAPFVLDGEGVPAFTGLESRESWKGWKPIASPRPFGRDLLLTYDRTD